MTFQVGEHAVASIEVRNSAGTLVDPAASMKIAITRRGITKVSATAMTPDSTGKYHYDYLTAETGPYEVEFTADDTTRVTKKRDTFEVG